ncbi:MAG: hypothetical protein ABIA04_10310 [Pseudomonadota bacterium]
MTKKIHGIILLIGILISTSIVSMEHSDETNPREERMITLVEIENLLNNYQFERYTEDDLKREIIPLALLLLDSHIPTNRIYAASLIISFGPLDLITDFIGLFNGLEFYQPLNPNIASVVYENNQYTFKENELSIPVIANEKALIEASSIWAAASIRAITDLNKKHSQYSPKLTAQILDKAGIVLFYMFNRIADNLSLYENKIRLAANWAQFKFTYNPSLNIRFDGLEYKRFQEITWFLPRISCIYKNLVQLSIQENENHELEKSQASDSITIEEIQYLSDEILKTSQRFLTVQGYGKDATKSAKKKLRKSNKTYKTQSLEEIFLIQDQGWNNFSETNICLNFNSFFSD